MSTPRFSANLLEQLGVTQWSTRPAYFENHAIHDDLKVSAAESQAVQGKVHQQDSGRSCESGKGEAEVSESSVSPAIGKLSEYQGAQADQSEFVANQPVQVVLVGSGLNAVWEDDSRLEWRLWRNICLALNWSEERVHYFDTDTLISDEALFATVEEIIGLGVESVLSMQADHPLSEMLSEGVQVLEVDTFEELLSDPYAKKSFYQAALKLAVPS